MQDYERLIKKVKGYPEFYQKGHKNYKNAKHKDHIWKIIAMEMKIPDPMIVKKKWTYLRDKFQKEYKKTQQASASGGSIESPWSLFENLSFLRDHVRFTSTPGDGSRPSSPYFKWNDESTDDPLLIAKKENELSLNSMISNISSASESRKRSQEDDNNISEIFDDPLLITKEEEELSLNTAITNNSSASENRKRRRENDKNISEIFGVVKRKYENESKKKEDDYIDHFCNFFKSFIRQWPQKDQHEAICHVTTYIVNKNPGFTK